MEIDVFSRGIQAPTDRVNECVSGNDRKVIACFGKWRQLRPLAARGIIDLVCRDCYLVHAAPTDGVNLAVQHSYAD